VNHAAAADVGNGVGDSARDHHDGDGGDCQSYAA
jgi:hypothetical protein